MDDGQEQDDASLVRAAQRGDREAFTLLFRRHYGTVRRVCARRLANGCDADEMAQAAFVRAYERISQCGGDRRFGAWVQVIALRLCGDAWRAQARVTPVADPVPSGSPAGPDVCLDAVLRRERAAAVRGALATLPTRQREVVVARYLEGRRPREVAAALAVSVGTVDSLLLRARRKLALACQASGVEHGAASASVTTTSFVAGTAAAGVRSLLRPFARLAGSLVGALDAAGARVSSAVGLGPATPTVAQRAAGLVGAGSLLLAPLVAPARPAPPAAAAPHALVLPAGPGAGVAVLTGALELPGVLAGGLAPVTLPPLAVPPLAVPPHPGPAGTPLAVPPHPGGGGPAGPAVAVPPVPELAGGCEAGSLAQVAGATGSAVAGSPLDQTVSVLVGATTLADPTSVVAQVATTVTSAAGDAAAAVSSTLDQVAGAVGVLLAGAAAASPTAP